MGWVDTCAACCASLRSDSGMAFSITDPTDFAPALRVDVAEHALDHTVLRTGAALGSARPRPSARDSASAPAPSGFDAPELHHPEALCLDDAFTCVAANAAAPSA